MCALYRVKILDCCAVKYECYYHLSLLNDTLVRREEKQVVLCSLFLLHPYSAKNKNYPRGIMSGILYSSSLIKHILCFKVSVLIYGDRELIFWWRIVEKIEYITETKCKGLCNLQMFFFLEPIILDLYYQYAFLHQERARLLLFFFLFLSSVPCCILGSSHI